MPFCLKSCRKYLADVAGSDSSAFVLLISILFLCVKLLTESDRDFIWDHEQSKHLFLCVWFFGSFCVELLAWSILGRDGGGGSWRPSCPASEASASTAKKSRTGMVQWTIWTTHPSLFLLPLLQICSFLSPPQLLAAAQFHFVKLLSIFVLHQLFSSPMLNDYSRMLFLVGL